MNCARMAVVDVYVILIDQVPVPVSYVGTGTSTLLLLCAQFVNEYLYRDTEDTV
jgi:hypothetical protein